MRKKLKFSDLDEAWNTIASIIEVAEELSKDHDRAGLKVIAGHLADATAAFVRLLKAERPFRVSLGVTGDRESWKDMSAGQILARISYEAKITGVVVEAKQTLLKNVRGATQKRLSSEVNKAIRVARLRVKEAKEYIDKQWPGQWQPDKYIERWL